MYKQLISGRTYPALKILRVKDERLRMRIHKSTYSIHIKVRNERKKKISGKTKGKPA
jgi:hypothetical protein